MIKKLSVLIALFIICFKPICQTVTTNDIIREKLKVNSAKTKTSAITCFSIGSVATILGVVINKNSQTLDGAVGGLALAYVGSSMTLVSFILYINALNTKRNAMSLSLGNQKVSKMNFKGNLYSTQPSISFIVRFKN